MHNSGDTVAHGGPSGRLDPDEPRMGVDESREGAGRVRTTPDASHHYIGVETEHLVTLRPGFVPDNSLELADHVGIGVGTHDRSDAVVRRLDRRDPVA